MEMGGALVGLWCDSFNVALRMGSSPLTGAIVWPTDLCVRASLKKENMSTSKSAPSKTIATIKYVLINNYS